MARSSASAKLAKYRSMRDFSRTAEPSGASLPAHPGHSFVIQQHAARRMHYDFRLELDGVLLSWSVPKGPSLSPTTRRLAVRTEDHPLDYAGFEGIIPAGQYGGGAVVVWDRGSWEPQRDAQEAMAKGRLTFTLHGEKLTGRWHLVKTKGEGKAETWLLFKGRDAAADDKLDIVAARPESVVSGKTVDQIAAAPERVWQSNRAVQAAAAPETAKPARSTKSARTLQAARRTVARPSQSRPASAPGEIQALVAQLPLGFPLTNLDKVLYPEDHVTKGALIAYLAVVADWALPHLARRPLTLVRCPEGIRGHAPGRTKACFFQKHRAPGSPPAVEAVQIDDGDGGTAAYMQVHDMAGLVALAQLGTLEIHTWGCHTDQIEQPDLMVFDLDPDLGLAWNKVALGAFELRRRLHDAGLESFVKTTGGKGLHVVVPITRPIGWDDFKAFSQTMVETLERDEPALYTTNMAKARRKDKIFLDYLRNGRGATFIAPYSPRARPGAPVAVPLRWEELAHGVDPATFTIATVPKRLAILRDDPWKQLGHVKQSITARTWRAVGGKPA
jgi:bifunctional non-homologous end joining protein LigD